MTGLSAIGEAAVLTPLTTTAYASLHTADPLDVGGNEVTGGAYARQGPVTFANASSNPTVAANSAIVTYVTATASWGTVTHFGIWDAATGGNFRGSGALSTPKLVSLGDTPRFIAGAMTITVD